MSDNLAPVFANPDLAKSMKTTLGTIINKEFTDGMAAGMPMSKETTHAANVAILSNIFSGEYAVLTLGLANRVLNGERKTMVEEFRADAHKMWEELFGTHPTPWKADANDKEEPFHFQEEGLPSFAALVDKIYKERIINLDKDNCRHVAWDYMLAGVSTLFAGSATLPILFTGVAYRIWNGEEEILLNDLHSDAKRYWDKYFSELDCPYDL